MPRYMLDTDTCSYIMRRSPDAVIKRLAKVPVSDVCISVISKSELMYGVEVSPKRRQDEGALASFLRYVEVLDFPDEASLHYAKIRAELKAAAVPREPAGLPWRSAPMNIIATLVSSNHIGPNWDLSSL